MSTARVNITDRAQRYRAQNAVTGPRKCVLCGSRSDLGVMHLDGNESHGEPANLAYGCRSCNGKLAAAFKSIGAGRPTNQYNPSTGVPTFAQYAWAVSNHTRGAHDEGGAVIHATPKHKRIEYARRIASGKAATSRERDSDRWNPASEALFSRANDWAIKHGYSLTRADGHSRVYDHPRGDRLLVDQRDGKFYHSAPQASRTDRDSSGSIGTLGKFLQKRENPWPWSRPDARRTTPAHGGIAYHQGKMKGRAAAPAKRKAVKEAGGSAMPDEAALQAGFKQGKTLSEILRGNPAEFGGKYAPIAGKYLQEVIDRYGESNVHVRWSNGQASAEEGTGGTVRLTIPKPRTVHNLYTFLHECGHALLGNLGENGSGAEYDAAQWALDAMRNEGVDVPDALLRQIRQAIAKDVKRDVRARRDVPQKIVDFTQSNPAESHWSVFYGDELLGSVTAETQAGARRAAIQEWTWLPGGSETGGIKYTAAERKKFRLRKDPKLPWYSGQYYKPTRNNRNPAAASAEVFEEFHGFAPSEVVTVSKKVHHHAHLAALGTLVQLDVFGVDGRGHKVQGFNGALLACNESRDQLFIEGGDQSINLKDFGIRGAHEMETLGRVTNIGYKTNKTHLGDEGGEAVYVHRFRATNQNGKHVVVKMTREPDLIYDVRNEQLLFSGGSYEILREGINQ